jgi:hypothetical protein
VAVSQPPHLAVGNPGEEPTREGFSRKWHEPGQVIAKDWKHSPKFLSSTNGVDFTDEASAEASATRVWKAAAVA